MPPAPRRQRTAPLGAWLAGIAGIAAVIAGTFLPWVVSGTVSRNLYTIAGIADRMGLFGNGSTVSGLLPLLGPLCLVPVVLAVVGWRRTAAVWGSALALACGASAGALLVALAGRSAAGMSLATAGPVTVLLGALLLAAGAVGQLAASARERRQGRDRLPAGVDPDRGSRRTATGEAPEGSH